MLRRAAFAGDWYPGDPGRLERALESYIGESQGDEEAVGIVAPHAGYIYSGGVAGAVYGRVRVPDTAVVLCVNHRGDGGRAAVHASGDWETPLGRVPVEEELARALLDEVPFLEEDSAAHVREHSLEMQVPFLQFRNRGVRIVPVCLQRLDYAECDALGEGLARAIRGFHAPVLLVASTDMTHFESQQAARRKDMLAIERVLEVDPRGLYEVVTGKRISMCGFIPTTAVLCACRSLGVAGGTLVQYATSGDVSGDYSSVVGYAGISLP
jgi:AmmeMemoRadiSam system protein B